MSEKNNHADKFQHLRNMKDLLFVGHVNHFVIE